MTRTDGPLSVQRSLTVDEWRALFRRADAGEFVVERAVPYRMLGIIWPRT
jgi:hypothetical protein